MIYALLFPIPPPYLRSWVDTCLEYTPDLSFSENRNFGAVLFFSFHKHKSFLHNPHTQVFERKLECALESFFSTPPPRYGAWGNRASEALGRALHSHTLAGVLPSPTTLTPFPFEKISLRFLPEVMSPFLEDEGLKNKMKLWEKWFSQLGLKTLGELAALPLKELRTKFAYDFRFLFEDPPWVPYTAPLTWLEELELEPSMEETRLEFFLKQLLDRLCLRLQASGKRILALRLRLDLTPYSHLKSQDLTREIPLHLGAPQSESLNILKVFQGVLENFFREHALTSPISKLTLEATEVVNGSGAQKDFFTEEELEAEKRNAHLLHLRELLGEKGLKHLTLRPHYFPHQMVQEIPLFQKVKLEENGFFLRRFPTRVLPEPIKLELRDWNSPPRTLGNFSSLLHWEFQERLSLPWWEEKATEGGWEEKNEEIDCYQVQTPAETLWVWKKKSEYYLAGYYD
jgi:hypothetical protein